MGWVTSGGGVEGQWSIRHMVRVREEGSVPRVRLIYTLDR